MKDFICHGATQLAINNSDLSMIPLLIPPKNVLEKFNLFVEPIFENVCVMQKEIKQIEEAIAFLSPLYMDGQIVNV
jgi:type I restriction enzyme S subunit